jgi:putative redox protein
MPAAKPPTVVELVWEHDLVLKKGRYDLRGLKVELIAERADTDPHRLTSVAMKYTITGDVPGPQVQRAIDLSRDKYCSVWHSLRQDIPLEATFTVSAGA